MEEKVRDLAKMIDHSILHPTFTDNDLKEGCETAKKYNVASVCVKPYMVKDAVELLKGADVKTSSGYGFVKQPNGDYNYAGATIHDLKLMKESVSAGVKIKAAGGVRNLDQLLDVQAAGASRCGATATKSLLEDAIKRFGG